MFKNAKLQNRYETLLSADAEDINGAELDFTEQHTSVFGYRPSLAKSNDSHGSKDTMATVVRNTSKSVVRETISVDTYVTCGDFHDTPLDSWTHHCQQRVVTQNQQRTSGISTWSGYTYFLYLLL